jgi:phospholipase C
VFARGRRFHARLWTVALIGAAVFALFGLPGAGPASAQPSPIRHIVVLYLENHSFDSVLGFWCDDHPARCPQGGMPRRVRLSDGKVVRPGVTPDVVPVLDHSVGGQRAAIDHGRMDGWQKIAGCFQHRRYVCISGYQPRQEPNLTALANAFAISDATFSMEDSPSWGGHLYAVAGSLDHFTGDIPFRAAGVPPLIGWGCNSHRVTRWVSPRGVIKLIPACIPDYSLGLRNGGAFEHTPAKYIPTIMDRLQAKRLSWRLYGQPTYGPGYVWDSCPSFAECLYTRQSDNNVPASEFTGDALAGRLPSFSIITPGAGHARNSEHNGASMTEGDNWLGQIASAVMHGPQWRSTVLFITWDDCGCFYDQVPPGVNPDGTQRGPRSPLVIVSPYARHGFTDTTATTFEGILAFAEKTFGLSPLAVNDAEAYPFTRAFNFSRPRFAVVPTATTPVPPGEHINMNEINQDT